MSNIIIRSELESRLKTWADAQVPKVPVAFEGMAFTKPSTGVFLEPTLIPMSTEDANVSGTRKRCYGVFHVNCWAKSGTGMRQVETLAQSIVTLFPLLPKTGAVSIESTPFVHEHDTDPAGWLIVPVTIQYRYES
jgi:hypothetical protein